MTEASAESALRRLEAKIRSRISIHDFHHECDKFLTRKRGNKELSDARLRRGSLKKVYDEVVPVRRFLLFSEIASGDLMFALNNSVPDCRLWRDGRETPLGIEVTVAQGRERYHLGTEIVRKGCGRGFIGLPDDAGNSRFRAALSKPRVCYSSGHALSTVKTGIIKCLQNKNDPKYNGMLLLIEAPLTVLPDHRWDQIKIELFSAAGSMPFEKIFVIDRGRPFGFPIKLV